MFLPSSFCDGSSAKAWLFGRKEKKAQLREWLACLVLLQTYPPGQREYNLGNIFASIHSRLRNEQSMVRRRQILLWCVVWAMHRSSQGRQKGRHHCCKIADHLVASVHCLVLTSPRFAPMTFVSAMTHLEARIQSQNTFPRPPVIWNYLRCQSFRCWSAQ